MFTSLITNPKKQLIHITIAYSLIALTGCGGGSSDTAKSGTGGEASANQVDTSNISQAKVRRDLNKGITQGIRSSINSISNVLDNSNVFSKLSTTSINASKAQTATLNTQTSDQINSSLDSFNKLIDKSDIEQNGNVYIFDPRETEICAEITSQKATNCEALLADFSFIMTVDKVENDSDITAATTVFQYESTPFATIGFNKKSGFYQINLAGTKTLIAGINRLVPEKDKTIIASDMEGSIRVSSMATSDNSGSLIVSIPTAVHIFDNAQGAEVDISIAATNKLLSITADGDAKSMELEVSLGVLNLLSSDANYGNGFSTQLVLKSLNGKLAVTENGDKLSLTGVTADSVSYKIGTNEALSLNLDSLNALVDSSGVFTSYTLKSALNFDLSINNIQNFFSSSSPVSNYFAISAKAPSGTVISDLDQNMIKVTNGSLELKVNSTGESLIDNIISSQECFSIASGSNSIFGPVSCPAGN